MSTFSCKITFLRYILH